MLLLIAGSLDTTSDLLVNELGRDKVFRFNYDLYKDYSLEFSPDFGEITSPSGHTINSVTVTSAFWWKAFSFFLRDQDTFIVEEVKYIFREIYHWCRIRGITKGNPHDFHNHLGKFNILNIASKYFATPNTLLSFKLAGVRKISCFDIVAKSLTSGLTATNKSLMTTAVEINQLSPEYPWFLQEKIESKFDITVFVCGHELFSFSRDRSNLIGLDWRSEQILDKDIQEWFHYELSEKQIINIKKFCKDISSDWGRIDFMERSNELVFLEYNANGQWVFLDYSGESNLVKKVAKYLVS